MRQQLKVVLVILAALAWTPSARVPASPSAAMRVIVQARDLESAALAVAGAGGTVTHRLGVINGVGAVVTPAQLAGLRRDRALRVFPDGVLGLAGHSGRPSHFPSVVEADQLHADGFTGKNVTIALVDTGWGGGDGAQLDTANQPRVLAGYNAIRNIEGLTTAKDQAGHGSHVLSVAVNSNYATDPARYNGVAPDARVVVVQAFDDNGWGTYSSVIRGIDWVISHRAQYNIRVLNCSFGAPPRSHYWEDPLNQAIMRAWQAGIVVVTSAGNTGPASQTVRVPGNVPYVITVGAMTDNFTPGNPSDDKLASFSSVGPTYDRFLKPELLAPGGHMLGVVELRSMLSRERPQLADRVSPLQQYYTMSGTSQSAAVVSGVAALMLQAHPELTPDDVKCRLLKTARAAVSPANQRAYSVFQQGAGLISARAAVASTATGCANIGLSVGDDLSGARHFAGRARKNADGTFSIDGFQGDGGVWNGLLPESEDGNSWRSGDPWTDIEQSLQGDPWTDNFLWPDGYPWNEGYLWGTGSETVSTNIWVPEQ